MSKKRGNGEGAIYHDKARNLWVARIMFIGLATGKKRPKTKYAKTRTLAPDELDKLRNDRKEGKICAPSAMTVADWLDFWLENIVRPTRRPSTHASYAQVARLHIKPHIGDLKVSGLTGGHVECLYGQLANAGKSARLRVMVHITLQAAVKAARRRKLIGMNPFEDIDPPRSEAPEMNAMTPEEARKFLAAACGQRLEALFVVAIVCGLRQGELFALRWEDIDLQAGTISVRRTVVELDGQFIENPPKSKKGRRMVELPEIVIAALKDHRRRMLTEGRVAADRLVFCDVAGGYLRRQNVARRVYAAILKAAG